MINTPTEPGGYWMFPILEDGSIGYDSGRVEQVWDSNGLRCRIAYIDRMPPCVWVPLVKPQLEHLEYLLAEHISASSGNRSR
jgi:hypothetical protein